VVNYFHARAILPGFTDAEAAKSMAISLMAKEIAELSIIFDEIAAHRTMSRRSLEELAEKGGGGK
jgi:hypothetical protein